MESWPTTDFVQVFNKDHWTPLFFKDMVCYINSSFPTRSGLDFISNSFIATALQQALYSWFHEQTLYIINIIQASFTKCLPLCAKRKLDFFFFLSFWKVIKYDKPIGHLSIFRSRLQKMPTLRHLPLVLLFVCKVILAIPQYLSRLQGKNAQSAYKQYWCH